MAALPFLTAFALYSATVLSAAPGTNVAAAFPLTGPSILPADDPWRAIIALLEAWALPVWSAGVLACALRLIFSARRVAQLRRAGDAPDPTLVELVRRLADRMRISKHVDVLLSRLAESPCVVGWLRPVILIPAASLAGLTAEQLENHTRPRTRAYSPPRLSSEPRAVPRGRRSSSTSPPSGWSPPASAANANYVATTSPSKSAETPVVYARALANLERLRIITPELAMSATSGPLLYRIRRLTGTVDDNPPSKTAAVLAACLALVCFLTNVHWASAQQPRSEVTVVTKDSIWVDTVKRGIWKLRSAASGLSRLRRPWN